MLRLSIDLKALLPLAASMSFVHPKEEVWDYISQNPLLTVVSGFYMNMISIHDAFIV